MANEKLQGISNLSMSKILNLLKVYIGGRILSEAADRALEDKKLLDKINEIKTLPSNGNPGQVLTQGEEGPEWKDVEVPEPDYSNIPVATREANGLMSSEDKIKLDGLGGKVGTYDYNNTDGAGFYVIHRNFSNGKDVFSNVTIVTFSYNYAGAILVQGLQEGETHTFICVSADDTEKTVILPTGNGFINPDGGDLTITVPAKGKGYAEINMLMGKDGIIYVRGV